jgi:hypothetical protein
MLIIRELMFLALGIALLVRDYRSATGVALGIFCAGLGLVQILRKIKTFHLTDTSLTIKRPLFPFKIATHVFKISDVHEMIINERGHLYIDSKKETESYLMLTSDENIRRLEDELRLLGVKISRAK